MKIIHTADIHLGSVMGNLPAQKAKQRKRELLDTFFRMLSFAKQKQLDAIVVAGDFFDGKKIARSVKQEVLEAIGNCGIDFLYLTGNHDRQIAFEDDLVVPSNFKKIEGVEDWQYFEYGDICIAGIDLCRQEGLGYTEKLRLSRAKFNICVLHGAPKEIPFDRLKDKNINYLALGDIHIPDIEAKRLDTRGIYGYSGCLEGRGFDETGRRGFFLLEVANGEFTRTFCPIAKRLVEIAEVSITDCDTYQKIYNAVCKKTEDISEENIVRVVLKGKYKVSTQKSTEELLHALSDKFFYAELKDQSILDMESVDFGKEISLRHEFVKLVSGSKLSTEQKDKIIEYGIKALCGEEVEL